MRMTYIIGPPGVGKTTFVAELTKGLPVHRAERPFVRSLYQCGVVELGEKRGTFSGTDALAMNVQPRVLDWATFPEYGDVLAEGDRLANLSFLQGMAGQGFAVTLLRLHADANRVALRRSERGTRQDETWVRGRVTKVTNLWEAWDGPKWVLSADESPEDMIGLAAALNLPVIDTLLEARRA